MGSGLSMAGMIILLPIYNQYFALDRKGGALIASLGDNGAP